MKIACSNCEIYIYIICQASILAIRKAAVLYVVGVACFQWSCIYIRESGPEVCEDRRQGERKLFGGSKESSPDDEP